MMISSTYLLYHNFYNRHTTILNFKLKYKVMNLRIKLLLTISSKSEHAMWAVKQTGLYCYLRILVTSVVVMSLCSRELVFTH